MFFPDRLEGELRFPDVDGCGAGVARAGAGAGAVSGEERLTRGLDVLWNFGGPFLCTGLFRMTVLLWR